MQVVDRKFAMTSHLKREILTLQAEPGSDLDELRLSKKFDLSRTPVREVFRELDGLGYVELRTHKGARVSQLSPRKLRDFFLAAPMIYESILRLAARNATSCQIDELELAQQSFCDALQSGNASESALANVRFHEITGEMAENVYLLPSFSRLLIDHARIGMTFYNPRSSEMAEKLDIAKEQHQEIIRAIRERDEIYSAELAHMHWELSKDQIEMFVVPDALDGRLGDCGFDKAGKNHNNLRFENHERVS